MPRVFDWILSIPASTILQQIFTDFAQWLPWHPTKGKKESRVIWPLFFSPLSERFLVPLFNQVFPSCVFPGTWQTLKALQEVSTSSDVPCYPDGSDHPQKLLETGCSRTWAVEQSLECENKKHLSKQQLKQATLCYILSSIPTTCCIAWPLPDSKPAPWHIIGVLTCGIGSQSFPTPTILAK